MFMALVGGDQVWSMMLDHWGGKSWRDIEADHGVPMTTARRWVTHAKMNLRKCGFCVDLIRINAAVVQPASK